MRRVWIAIVVSSIGWGTGGVATRVALAEGTSPYAIAAYRGLIAAAAVIGYLVVRRRGLPPSATAWRVGVTMGVSNLAVPFVLSNIALQYASAGFLGLMMALIPISTAVIAHFILVGETLTPSRFIGLTVALAGVAVLLASGDSGLAEGGRPLFAGLLGLCAVVSIAYGGVYAKRYAGEYRSLDASGVHFVSGSVVVLAAMLFAEGLPGGVSTLSGLMLIYLGLFSTFLPFVLYYWLLRQVSATYASMAGYVVPVIAVTAGLVVLDERLQVGIVLGGLLILVGVLLTDRSYRRS